MLRSGACWMCLAAAAYGQTYSAPRTPDGHPDLQGVWSNATVTPFERPAEFAGKPFLTPAEAAAYEKKIVDRNNADRRESDPDADVATGYNNFWWDRGSKVVPTLRTSMVVDPPDGKIPPLTPEAQKRMADIRAAAVGHESDGPENRTLSDRCIFRGSAGPPMVPGGYNNNYQIVQGEGYVVIVSEMIHDARIIPTDGRPHVPSGVRLYTGDSRGRWDGNTLVVDTTNFTDKTRYRGSSPNLHLVERFTRTGADTILYEFTVDDPASFTKPWTAQVPLRKSPDQIFEYACHEGNYSMVNTLSAARATEQKAAEGVAREHSK